MVSSKRKWEIAAVKWRDPTTYHEWQSYENGIEKEPRAFYTVGRIISKTKKTVKIASTLGLIETMAVLTLPHGCVIGIIPMGFLEADYEDN